MKSVATIIMCSLLAVVFTGTVAGDEITYLDAPKIVPGSTEEMQHPELWIANIKDDPDRVILTPAQIGVINYVRDNPRYSKILPVINARFK